jgi:hypothetical protein
VGSQRIKNWPTKERPRERLLAEGPERLTDADLLAIILRIGLGTFKEGVPGKNAYESALSILVHAQLKKAEARQAARQIAFKAQVSHRFWSADSMQKTIRPDIIAHIGTGADLERIVMDTKWKIPGDGKPGDADLQQMYAYNVQFGARRSFLLYPRVTAKAGVRGRFVHGKALPPSFDHNCGMVFIELFDGDKLRRDLGNDLVAMLTSAE